MPNKDSVYIIRGRGLPRGTEKDPFHKPNTGLGMSQEFEKVCALTFGKSFSQQGNLLVKTPEEAPGLATDAGWGC